MSGHASSERPKPLIERAQRPCMLAGYGLMAVAFLLHSDWPIYPGYALTWTGFRVLPHLARRRPPAAEEPSGFGQPISDEAFKALWYGRIGDDPPSQSLH